MIMQMSKFIIVNVLVRPIRKFGSSCAKLTMKRLAILCSVSLVLVCCVSFTHGSHGTEKSILSKIGDYLRSFSRSKTSRDGLLLRQRMMYKEEQNWQKEENRRREENKRQKEQERIFGLNDLLNDLDSGNLSMSSMKTSSLFRRNITTID